MPPALRHSPVHLTRPRISCSRPALSSCCSSRRRFSPSPLMLRAGREPGQPHRRSVRCGSRCGLRSQSAPHQQASQQRAHPAGPPAGPGHQQAHLGIQASGSTTQPRCCSRRSLAALEPGVSLATNPPSMAPSGSRWRRLAAGTAPLKPPPPPQALPLAAELALVAVLAGMGSRKKAICGGGGVRVQVCAQGRGQARGRAARWAWRARGHGYTRGRPAPGSPQGTLSARLVVGQRNIDVHQPVLDRLLGGGRGVEGAGVGHGGWPGRSQERRLGTRAGWCLPGRPARRARPRSRRRRARGSRLQGVVQAQVPQCARHVGERAREVVGPRPLVSHLREVPRAGNRVGRRATEGIAAPQQHTPLHAYARADALAPSAPPAHLALELGQQVGVGQQLGGGGAGEEGVGGEGGEGASAAGAPAPEAVAPAFLPHTATYDPSARRPHLLRVPQVRQAQVLKVLGVGAAQLLLGRGGAAGWAGWGGAGGSAKSGGRTRPARPCPAGCPAEYATPVPVLASSAG